MRVIEGHEYPDKIHVTVFSMPDAEKVVFVRPLPEDGDDPLLTTTTAQWPATAPASIEWCLNALYHLLTELAQEAPETSFETVMFLLERDAGIQEGVPQSSFMLRVKRSVPAEERQ